MGENNEKWRQLQSPIRSQALIAAGGSCLPRQQMEIESDAQEATEALQGHLRQSGAGMRPIYGGDGWTYRHTAVLMRYIYVPRDEH